MKKMIMIVTIAAGMICSAKSYEYVQIENAGKTNEVTRVISLKTSEDFVTRTAINNQAINLKVTAANIGICGRLFGEKKALDKSREILVETFGFSMDEICAMQGNEQAIALMQTIILDPDRASDKEKVNAVKAEMKKAKAATAKAAK